MLKLFPRITLSPRTATSLHKGDQISTVHRYSGSTVKLDIELSHPFYKDVLARAAWLNGTAASRREQCEHKKYSAQRGFSLSAIPRDGGEGEEPPKYI